MFNEPTEKEVNLMPLVLHGASELAQTRLMRATGFGMCGQISFCFDGEGTFTDSDNRTYNVKRGDIFFFAPETPHRYAPTKDPWIIRYIIFSGCELKNIFQSLNLPASGFISAEALAGFGAEELLDNIFESYNSGKKSRHIITSAYLYRLLVILSKSAQYNTERRDSDILRLSSAVDLINKSFHDKSLSSDLIAEKSNISHSHMCRLFKSTYGMSPHDYIIHTRIEYAKFLLCIEKNMTVQEISDKCGFSSSGYFIKVFKSKTALTPTEFRAQNTYSF